MASEGDEIVLSVDETNKIRAKLGLAPLQVDERELEERRWREEQEKKRMEAEQREVAERLQKAREAREAERALRGPTIATMHGDDDDDDDDDALSWVLRSKARQAKRAKEVEMLIRQKQEAAAKAAEYTSKDLQGLAVAHDSSEFEEGETRILTLADARVIDADGRALNDAQDELMDIEKAEMSVVKKNNELRKKKPAYDVFEALEGKSKTILSQYDEERKRDGMVISGGVAAGASDKEARLARIRARLGSAKPAAVDVSATTEQSLASDFYTREEMESFRKPKKKKKKKKKATKLRDTKIDLLKELSEDVDGADADLEDEDHGNREDQQQKVAARKALEAQRKANAYAAALEKASQSALKVLASGEDESALLEDDDELYDSLHQARAKTQIARAKKAVAKPEDIALTIANRVKAEPKSDDDGEDLLGDNLTLSETSEFCHVLKVAQQEREEDHERARVKRERVSDDEQPEENLDNHMDVEKREDGEGGERVNGGEASGDDEEDGAHSIVGGEKLYSDSLASCLSIMNHSIRPFEDNIEEIAGRPNDERWAIKGDPAPGINLDHRDEYGRLMTPHEAFRHLSHKFHGRPPSKNKQAKMQKRYEEDMRRRLMGTTDTPLQTAAKVTEKLKDAQQPFVVLGQKREEKELFSEVLQTKVEPEQPVQVEQGPQVGFQFRTGKLNKKRKPRPKKKVRPEEEAPPMVPSYRSRPHYGGGRDDQPRGRPRYRE